MSEQTANLCTTDACESLRARLAKYEDAEGRPVVAGDFATLIRDLRNLAGVQSWASEPLSSAAEALESQEREIERLTQHIEHQDDAYSLLSLDAGRKMDELERELAALKAQPSGVVPGVLAECFFHALPDEDDWEVHDPRHMSGDCDGCVQAVIVSRADWEHLNSSPVSSAPSDQYRDLIWMAHQLADMVLKGDAPHTAVRVAKSLMRECEGKASAPSHGEQVRDGWQWVPVEPNEAIRDAINLLCDDHSAFEDSDAFWSYLLAAAPSAGSQEQG